MHRASWSMEWQDDGLGGSDEADDRLRLSDVGKLEDALDELLDTRNAMTRVLLGGRGRRDGTATERETEGGE